MIRGSAFNDEFILEDADLTDLANPGQMRVRVQGANFTIDGTNFENSFTFNNPSDSLKILGGSGGDKITVASVDALFAADLLIYGNIDKLPFLNEFGLATLEPDVAADEVYFTGNTYTRGGYLEAFADKIVVAEGVTLPPCPILILCPVSPANSMAG